MGKVYSKDHINDRVATTINDLQKKAKEQRTNQLGWKGYIVLPSLSADPSGAPDGSTYYNTTAHTMKVKLNGSWKTVTAA